MGNETLAARRALAELCGPTRLAYVKPFVALLLVGKQRVIRLFVGERMCASLARVRAGLDIPLDHLVTGVNVSSCWVVS